MPRSRRKLTQSSSLNPPNNINQPSVSKYFFPCTTNQSSVRKRFSSTVTNVVSAQKAPKFSCFSNNPPDLETDISSSRGASLDYKSELCNKDLNEKIVASGSSKNKLSNLKYSKQNKSAVKFSELIKPEKVTDAGNLAFEKMDIDTNAVVENLEHNAIKIQDDSMYTPLIKQYLEFQAKYPDAVLMLECGYNYRFFGKDAKIASKNLNISCFQYHNFPCASIPVHRLHHHARRLVLKGHKVAVIKQTESTALKAASETRNELFTRELHAMYTKSTFIEGDLSVFNDENSIEVGDANENDVVSGYLICINEKKISKSQSDDVNIACVALQVSSGDIFYSLFQERLIKNELESFLMCISPSEIILPSSQLSKKTENLVKSFTHDRSSRVERLDDKLFEHSFSLSSMSRFICDQEDTKSCDNQDNLQILLSLPPLVVSCLSALKVYLSDFKVENILKNVKYALFK